MKCVLCLKELDPRGERWVRVSANGSESDPTCNPCMQKLPSRPWGPK